MIGIIGGSGLYEGLKGLEGVEKIISTEFGSVKIIVGDGFVFLSRHGSPPKPPHMINYHANIKALKIAGVNNVVAISSVGSLKKELSPGTIFMPDDLLDFTSKVWTYHNSSPHHVNLYEPFCENLRKRISLKLKITAGGTYATMKGPQFETRAEERMLKILGADVVGMTVAPEAKLSKEIGLCYQPLCIVVNYVSKNTTHQNTLENMKRYENKIREISIRLINLYKDKKY